MKSDEILNTILEEMGFSNVNSINYDLKLSELNFSSLEIVDLVVTLQEKYKVVFADKELLSFTLNDIKKRVEGALNYE